MFVCIRVFSPASLILPPPYLQEAKDVRDSIEAHLIALERSLASYDANVRKRGLHNSLKHMSKAIALTTLLSKNVHDEQLALRTPARRVTGPDERLDVPLAHPDMRASSASKGPFSVCACVPWCFCFFCSDHLAVVHSAAAQRDALGSAGGSMTAVAVPAAVAPSLRFEGHNASQPLQDWNALKGVTDRRTTDTLTAARVSEIKPPSKATRGAKRAARISERPSRAKIKQEAKDALTNTNFSTAASLSRAGLELGADQALL